MAKYSIILPVRNGMNYLKECIGSILKQEFPDFTLHILENASTDGTADWVQSLTDPRIRLLPSNSPLSIEENWARIKSIEKNEFMTMIGHDDVLEPHYLTEIEKLTRKYPDASIYQTHFDYIDAQGRHRRTCKPMDHVQYGYEFLASQMAGTIDSMGTGYVMRSADFNAVGGMSPNYPNLMFADYELWIKLTNIKYKAVSQRHCFNYREHDSVSRVTNGMTYQQAFSVYLEFLLEQKRTNPDMEIVIERYGREFLMKFCESLAHRLLKTPIALRSMSVKQLVERFSGFAAQLIPTQGFNPYAIPRIRYAISIDQNPIARALFTSYKRYSAQRSSKK
jgi:glycosyltransferase involved in cell wall biosynthesis